MRQPLTLAIMSKVAGTAFHRVQRFSTDWHANSFAGSVVRKITRGMWALDLINDVLLLMLWPSLWSSSAPCCCSASIGRSWAW